MPAVREVQVGVWHWEAPHPDWTEEDGGPQGWGPQVSSYAIEDGRRLLLIDPLALPGPVEGGGGGGEPVIVLTCPWHERDARTLAERLDAQVFVPPPEAGTSDPLDGQVF